MYRNNFPNEQEKANNKWREFAGVSDSPPSIEPRRASVHSSSRKQYTPTREQLDLLLPDPIRCFCNKPAHKAYTAEYGPVYECASFDYDNKDRSKFQSKYICGFHIHERSWVKLIDELKNEKDISLEFSEVQTCPQYNFTFCSIFKVSNSYTLAHPDQLPACFCRRPVTMRISQQGFIQFACQNGLIDGAKKCSWVLPSKEVAFPKPKCRLHSLMDEQHYLEQKEQKRSELLSKATSISHKMGLLATLEAFQPSLDLPPIIRKQEEKGFIIPTSVMMKKQQQQKARQISPSSSSSVSSNVSTPSMKPQDMESPRHLQHIIEGLKQTHLESMSHAKEQIEEYKKKMSQLQIDLYRMKNEKIEESIFTANCQERLSNIELDVVRLMNENQKLTDENIAMREEIHELTTLKEEELNKCIVCYTQPIDSCLKPCYHYAYCQMCAPKLSSCAICRKPVKSVQRIYQC